MSIGHNKALKNAIGLLKSFRSSLESQLSREEINSKTLFVNFSKDEFEVSFKILGYELFLENRDLEDLADRMLRFAYPELYDEDGRFNEIVFEQLDFEEESIENLLENGVEKEYDDLGHTLH